LKREDPEELADLRRRYFNLRMAVRQLTSASGPEPEHHAHVRERELAAEVARADRESDATIPERLPRMEAMLNERGLLESALRQVRSIENMDDRSTP
jgi:hypothetical protein